MIELEEEWQARLADLEERLRETEEKLKKERRIANEKIAEATAAKHSLQQKLETANTKNKLLSSLMNQYNRSSEVSHREIYIYSVDGGALIRRVKIVTEWFAFDTGKPGLD